jgi:metal-dependent amidase/aminoacylase/carboxypeptidase family protein
MNQRDRAEEKHGKRKSARVCRGERQQWSGAPRESRALPAVTGYNWRALPAGQFAIQPGPMVAALDVFEIEIKGRGAYAAMPHLVVDPIAAAAQVVNGLHTIVNRNTYPLEGAVSVTRIHGGDTWKVIPETVVLRETTRSFNPPCATKSSRKSAV